MRGLFLSIAVAAAIPFGAQAASLTVSNAWFRSLPAGLPAGGYFTLHNAGAVDAVLTAASSPACASIMLHKSETMDGMSGMEMAENVAVPAHGSVAFAPGGYHLMCTGPKMKPGATVSVMLQFADGTKLTVPFAVKDARGK
jgi:periplasmic copper chaperone A